MFFLPEASSRPPDFHPLEHRLHLVALRDIGVVVGDVALDRGVEVLAGVEDGADRLDDRVELALVELGVDFDQARLDALELRLEHLFPAAGERVDLGGDRRQRPDAAVVDVALGGGGILQHPLDLEREVARRRSSCSTRLADSAGAITSASRRAFCSLSSSA